MIRQSARNRLHILAPGITVSQWLPVGAVQTVYVYDSFTGADSTQLTAHAPDIDVVGGGWVNAILTTTPGANASILSNKASITADNAGTIINAGQANVEIEATWTLAVGVDNRSSIALRYVDASNWIIFNVREPNGDLLLNKRVAGSTSTVASAAFSWTEGQTYTLKITANGTAVVCYVDDVEVLSGTIAELTTATKHGIFRNAGNSNSLFDDFYIRSLP
jgi:hypothetical protein